MRTYGGTYDQYLDTPLYAVEWFQRLDAEDARAEQERNTKTG